MIDVSRMNTVEIDEKRRLVKVGGGVKNRELYEAITKVQSTYPSYEYFKSTGRFVDRCFNFPQSIQPLDE